MSTLKRPIITEKATRLSEKTGKYSFVVAKEANKIEIKNAVEKMYNVTVEEVNTITMPAKIKTRYTTKGMTVGRKGGIKKAVITLKKGETIDFYSNI
ncbi:MAG: hypothetical protein RIQ89_88 [Bacteroidota bacterium]|jgi:large subunit ribosomal protein L23